MADLLPTIEGNAAGPKQMTGVAGGSAVQHSLPDQIAADKYAKANAALQTSATGIRYVRTRGSAASDVYIDRC